MPFPSSFSTNPSTFIQPMPVFSIQTAQPAISPTTPTMRCRRDLKKEKSIRNFAFARVHRKRKPRYFNRRAAAEASQLEDNQYLSSIYGTMSFGAAAKEKDENNKSK